MAWTELSPVLVGVVVLAAHKRLGDVMVKRAVQFHSSPEQKRRAESQRRLAHVIAAVAGVGFIVLGLVDAFLLDDSTTGAEGDP